MPYILPGSTIEDLGTTKKASKYYHKIDRENAKNNSPKYKRYKSLNEFVHRKRIELRSLGLYTRKQLRGKGFWDCYRDYKKTLVNTRASLCS